MPLEGDASAEKNVIRVADPDLVLCEVLKMLAPPLNPIPNWVVFFFVQAGWPIDEVLQLCVDRMNGLPNVHSTLLSAEHQAGETV